MELLLRRSVDHRQSGRVSHVPEVGQRLQGFLCGKWESAQFAGHQVDDVVCITLGPDWPEIPVPFRIGRFEGDQTTIDEACRN